MKNALSTGLLSLAVLAAPVAALAQSGPPGPGYSPSPAQQQQMQQARAQMEQIHAQERSQILAALSPAHKSLLANIAGGLATGAVADRRVAAQQLDAALSPQEKQAVVSIDQNVRSRTMAMHQQMMAQMQSQLSPAQQQEMQQHMQQMQARRNAAGTRTPDPGMIVLRATTDGGPGGPGEHGPGRGF